MRYSYNFIFLLSMHKITLLYSSSKEGGNYAGIIIIIGSFLMHSKVLWDQSRLYKLYIAA